MDVVVRVGEGLAASAGALAEGSVWEELGAVLLLAGSSRKPELSLTGRSPLDLPLAGGETVLDRLVSGMEGLGESGLEVRLLTGHGGPGGELPLPRERGLPWMRVERDPHALRGTGGVLADATSGYQPDALVLVVQAAQVRSEGVARTAARLLAVARSEGADVVISTDAVDGPDGVMLVRCGALRGVKTLGFVDFKEQALSELAKTHRVSVSRGEGMAIPVRTLRDYLRAVRVVAGAGDRDPLAELDPASGSAFRVVEEGASVGEGAVLVDSVVLRGATVESGAAVIRTVVGEGARVRKSATISDRLVGGSDRAATEPG